MKDVEDRIKQQGEHGPPPIVAKALAAIAKTTRAELRRLEAAIAAKIKANPALPTGRNRHERAGPFRRSDRRRRNRLAARARRIRNEAAAALIGAAPYDDDSGGRKGQRHIKGGRRKLRDLLFMPVMGAATQHNPVLKAYYQRLRARARKPRSPSSPACAS